MYYGYLEEGDRCPSCFKGNLGYNPVEGCSCHINPPCSACVNNPLVCQSCGHEIENEPPHKTFQIVPGLSERVYKPKPLDKTKISWRIKPHTHFTMICEGVYPEGKTRQDVLDKVKGTFGGRFEHFGNGRFKYIAYTD